MTADGPVTDITVSPPLEVERTTDGRAHLTIGGLPRLWAMLYCHEDVVVGGRSRRAWSWKEVIPAPGGTWEILPPDEGKSGTAYMTPAFEANEDNQAHEGDVAELIPGREQPQSAENPWRFEYFFVDTIDARLMPNCAGTPHDPDDDLEEVVIQRVCQEKADVPTCGTVETEGGPAGDCAEGDREFVKNVRLEERRIKIPKKWIVPDPSTGKVCEDAPDDCCYDSDIECPLVECCGGIMIPKTLSVTWDGAPYALTYQGGAGACDGNPSCADDHHVWKTAQGGLCVPDGMGGSLCYTLFMVSCCNDLGGATVEDPTPNRPCAATRTYAGIAVVLLPYSGADPDKDDPCHYKDENVFTSLAGPSGSGEGVGEYICEPFELSILGVFAGVEGPYDILITE